MAVTGSVQGCISDEALAAWVEGQVSPGEVARMTAHLAACATCRAVLAALARGAGVTPPGLSPESGPRSRGGSR